MNFKITALIISMSASGYLHAQLKAEQTSTDSQNIESISVIGARTPITSSFVASAISVIDQQQIQSSGAVSLSELLRTVPSMNISQAGPMGTLSEIRFRGSESNHVLVMVDGVEINDLGQGGLIDLSHLMLANVSRIEILRGPQSALWGSAALAGVINISTVSPAQQSAGNLAVGLGYRQSSQVQGAYNDDIGKLKYSISASHFNTEGDNIARSGDEADGYENTTAYASMGYHFSENNRINARLRSVNYHSDFDATDFSSGLIADADNISDGEQLSFGLDWHFGLKDSIWSQQLSYQYSKQKNKNFADQSFTGSSKGEKHRLIYNHNLALSSGHVNFGLETVNERFEQAGPISFGDPNQRQQSDSVSFITDFSQSITKQLSTSASYRYDNNEEFKNAESYRIGLNYQVNERIRTFVSYAKAVKNPSFTERFGFFPGTFLGNADLQPESSRSVEWGIDANWQDYQLNIALFSASLDNEILGFVFDPDSGLFTAQNSAEESLRDGAEIELTRTVKQFRWALSYAYLDATEADSVELRRARHSGSAWLSYEIDRQHQIYVQADYTGTRADRFFPPFPQPSQVLKLENYWLISANYRYQFNPNAAVAVRLSNALNEQYEDIIGFSGESRRVMFNLSYSW